MLLYYVALLGYHGNFFYKPFPISFQTLLTSPWSRDYGSHWADKDTSFRRQGRLSLSPKVFLITLNPYFVDQVAILSILAFGSRKEFEIVTSYLPILWFILGPYGHVYGRLSGLLRDVGESSPLRHTRKLTKQKPERSQQVAFLHNFCLEFLPWLGPVMDCDLELEAKWAIFLPKLLWVLVFLTAAKWN